MWTKRETGVRQRAIIAVGRQDDRASSQSEAFSFQIAADTQEETGRYWNVIVGNGAEARRAFEAMMEMTKIDVAKIDAARRG